MLKFKVPILSLWPCVNPSNSWKQSSILYSISMTWKYWGWMNNKRISLKYFFFSFIFSKIQNWSIRHDTISDQTGCFIWNICQNMCQCWNDIHSICSKIFMDTWSGLQFNLDAIKISFNLHGTLLGHAKFQIYIWM